MARMWIWLQHASAQCHVTRDVNVMDFYRVELWGLNHLQRISATLGLSRLELSAPDFSFWPQTVHFVEKERFIAIENLKKTVENFAA